ncbi:MAG: hypothetical protein H7X77_01730 [Anaerolineae bacterium]|nr:hypothetical protein [Anaerolineae bacterium]
MAVEVWWYVAGRVVYSPGSTAPEDIAERNARLLEMIESAGQPPMVHCLIDHTNRYTPEELQQQPKRLHEYLKIDRNEIREKLITHPLNGWVLSIKPPNPIFKLAGAVISQQSHYRWRSFDSLEDALDFLQHTDATLPPLPRPEAGKSSYGAQPSHSTICG